MVRDIQLSFSALMLGCSVRYYEGGSKSKVNLRVEALQSTQCEPSGCLNHCQILGIVAMSHCQVQLVLCLCPIALLPVYALMVWTGITFPFLILSFHLHPRLPSSPMCKVS
jgi:hypothetical protein